MYNDIIVTTANSLYFNSLLTLINGVHKFGLDCIDKILVYDLGLCDEEIQKLKKLKMVDVLKYPNDVVINHPRFMEPRSHVYKLFCLYDAKKYSKNILWLDAGVTPINPMCEMFQIIEKDEVFMVVDEHLTGNFTHTECVKIMSASEQELSDKMLSSGIIGFKNEGKYDKLFIEAYEYSLINGCVDGDHENHRHDQSVLSILATRYSCPKQDINKYGYWTDINRNLKSALENNSIIFVHRRGYDNKQDLIYEN